MYQEMARANLFDFEVWYCTRHGLNAEVDKQFGRAVQWDIPILEGYAHKFLKNHARRPSIYSTWGILNLGIFREICRLPRKSAVVVFGWNNFTYLAAVIACKLCGHSAFFRTENPFKKEKLRRGIVSRLQRLLLQHLLFPLADRFLFIGEQNKMFYRRYGVPDSKFVFSPYAVDNRRFAAQAEKLCSQKQNIKQELGLPADKKIVLFIGKFIPVKRPLDLVEAFRQLARNIDSVLVMVGDGELKNDILDKISAFGLQDKVCLPGFVNQSEIARYYAAADVLVLCSNSETWGLSVNEAMNFGLPVVVSDMVGCGDNLVEEGLNGFVFPTGDTSQMAEKLRLVLQNDTWRTSAGAASKKIVERHSYAATIQNLAALCAPPV
jgi:glycosyltransferase involved in cell wall biosynthesis